MNLLRAYALAVSCTFATLVSAAPQPETWRNPKDGMEFVRVPAGEIQLLGPEGTNLVKTSFAEGFWLGRTEVTVGQFRKFVKATGYTTEAETAGNLWTWKSPGFKQRSDHPVVFLEFQDAVRYTKWAGVDLPTEAEWLYACRAGTNTRYYWGEELDGAFAWYRGNTQASGTRPVGRKLPNAWGYYDMVGNAREYCRVGSTGWDARGSSWTRCERYVPRQGGIAEHLLAEGLESRLHQFDPKPLYPLPFR
jgi:formylglycine-generating enzyme required for sulfatase activity